MSLTFASTPAAPEQCLAAWAGGGKDFPTACHPGGTQLAWRHLRASQTPSWGPPLGICVRAAPLYSGPLSVGAAAHAPLQLVGGVVVRSAHVTMREAGVAPYRVSLEGISGHVRGIVGALLLPPIHQCFQTMGNEAYHGIPLSRYALTS